MGKLNVMQHPVYNAVHICSGCGKLKLVTKWVEFDPCYLGAETYVVRTHCPDCFRNIIRLMEDKKRRQTELKIEKQIRNKVKTRLS